MFSEVFLCYNLPMAEEKFIEAQNLGSFFKEALRDQNNVFVFSTDVVMNSWADWCVTHPEQSGVQAVPLERFTAWDKFKGEVVRGKEEGRVSIPAILRKFFVSSLISRNAESSESETIFKKLINPEFRGDASSFADWISNILKSLNLWHKTLMAHPDYEMDDEDRDYLALYERYKAFLDENNFFEPSWVEPDFSATGRHYIIFYPEILEDYSDYIDVFKKCPDITIVSLPKESGEKKIPCIKYSDSRKELRRTILAIRRLCAGGFKESKEGEKVRWDQVTLSVPDLQTLRPYLERELTKYCVPFVIRAGFPLIQNTAGQVFTEIQNCFNTGFSYESMRSLLLDEYIPWKEELKVLRENLIQEGNRMRCICGFEEQAEGGKVHFDSWEAALSATSSENNRELNFYRDLKHDVSAICRANSFDGIIQAWLIFRDKYLAGEEFSKIADAVLGRCITELKELAQVEKEYCGQGKTALSVSNHYDFFITELGKKSYTPQEQKRGISVYPYKLTAGAYFPHQFVIDSSQKNLEIQYKKLGFLNEEKRRMLALQNDDKKFNASKAFIRLYSATNSHFSYAEESFSGFAICHNALAQIEDHESSLDDEDFILAEKNYMMARPFASPLRLSKAQKDNIARFQSFNIEESDSRDDGAGSKLLEKVKFTLVENRSKNLPESERDGKIVITQSDMKKFFPCPRKWIFSSVLSLEEESLDTDLMQTFDMGNINHRVLELFMKDYQKSQMPLPVCNGGLFENEEEILATLKKHALTAIKDSARDYSKSPLSQKMLESQLDSLARALLVFLKDFLQPNMPSGANINTKTKTLGYGGCVVYGVEKSYSAKNEDKKYNYYGKIDLLLKPAKKNLEADGWTIIDYKNSSMPKAEDIKVKNEKLGDFQMPMYISLIAANESVGDVDAARFYSIKKSSSNCAIDRNTANCSQEDFKPTMEAFEKYSDEFERLVSEQKFSPDSEKVDLYEDCLQCNFKSVCRRSYEVAKRK